MDTALNLKLEREPSLGMDDAVPVRGAADAGAAGRFNDYMTAPAGGVDGVAPASPAVEDVATRAARVTPGDSILNGLNSMSADMGRDLRFVNDTLGAKSVPGVADMLRIQVSLISLSIHHELVGKLVSRSTQNLDQLVKLQ